jgi:hypothetical protein
LLRSSFVHTFGAIQLQDRRDMDFPDTLFDRSLLFAFERLFIFAAPRLALNLDMGSFLERGGEVGQRPKNDSTMPFRARFPFAGLLVLPRRLGGKR